MHILGHGSHAGNKISGTQGLSGLGSVETQEEFPGVMESFLEEADGSRMIHRGFQDLSGARSEIEKVTTLGQNVAQTRTLGCMLVLMYFICII